MVSTPRTRHSRTGKEPVTIDLEAERESAGPATDDTAAAAASQESPEAKAAGETPGDAPAARASGAGRDGGEATPQPPARRTSIIALLLAGVIGGAAALGGAVALDRAGVLSLGSAGEEGRDTEAAMEALVQQVAGLRSEQARLGETSGELASRIDAAESMQAALRSEIEALPASGGSDASLPGDWVERLEAVEQSLAERQDVSAPAMSENELAGLEDELSTVQEIARTALSAAETQAGVLDTMRNELRDLASRIQTESARPEVALAIAAVALKSAIDSGQPFAMQLDTYASVAPGSPEIEALRDVAMTGVPTRNEIAANAAEAANAIVAATNRVDDGAGYMDRMLASLRSLVKVRPVGMVEGDSPAAIAARIEVALGENDYPRAFEEFEKLPQEAREAGADFMAGVRARMETDQLIDRALATALRSAG